MKVIQKGFIDSNFFNGEKMSKRIYVVRILTG